MDTPKRRRRAPKQEEKPAPKDQFEFSRRLEPVCRFCGWSKEHHAQMNKDGVLPCLVEFEPPYASLNDKFCNAH